MFMIIVSTQFKIRQCSQCQGDTEFYCDKCKHDLCLQCKERHVTNFPTKYHKVVFYKAHRSEKSLIKQCKMRQCFQCQGDTEFYCNTCKHDLCLQCKDRHVIDLSTKHHDIVIYLEKYENILKQEKCVRHPDRIYETYCQSCELSLCSQCKEHRKHQIQDIRTAYKTNRQQHRDYFHNIRSETLYNSCFFLAGIKTDMKACRSEISNRRSEILSKAQRLKDLIDTVVVDIIVGLRKYMLHRLQNQKRKMKRHLVNIENYEHRSKWSGIRQIKILLFVKKTLDPKIKDNLNLTQHVFLSLSKEINTEDVMKLGEIQIIQKGIRQVRNESVLKLMSTPMLHKTVTVADVKNVIHFSFVTSDHFWINDNNSLILTNTEGETEHHLTDSSSLWGIHTVSISCDLIYIDKENNISKLSKDKETKSIMMKKTDPWIPYCIYCSPSSGDLLVGMYRFDTKIGKVTRHNGVGQHIQTIQYSKTSQGLYSRPNYITENRNGDVIVSNIIGIFHGDVVVTDHRGTYRFSYTGPPSGSELCPYGICTDALSHILVCDYNTDTIQLIDKDGQFLTLILTELQGIHRPGSLSYDDKTHALWVGSLNSKKMRVYRYIERQNYPTCCSN